MGDLFGTFDNLHIDDKGRLSIPTSLRKALSKQAKNTFMILRGTEGCLFAYPRDEWMHFWGQLRRLPHTPENTRLTRRILGSLKEVKLDGQGRLTLTQKLKEYGSIRENVTIMGRGEKLEIWDGEMWRRRQQADEEAAPYDQDLYRAVGETEKNRHDG